ncbi:MAG: dTDP-4-dehydrorhamnose reductase, partial [Paracoccaceae bacterium]|nr:dTDP-4-dehydrorhamnose reductase [Paracoccaceae bacterium]
MILVFGKTGQLATELQRQGDVTALGRDEVDLENVLACAGAIRKHKPDTVINAAAYTAVDRAEEDGASAALINGAAPRIMAEAAAEVGAKFIHVSTDYVFDGTGDRPWKPEDRPRPQGAYGRTKLSGEEGIRRAGGSHVILRTSWVFSDVGSNFVKTMLRLGAERGELRVVDDQIGGPTPAADIAAALLKIADRLGE